MQKVLGFLVGLRPAGNHIGTPTPDGSHNAEFLGDLLERSVLGEPLKSVSHGFLISHNTKLSLCTIDCKSGVEWGSLFVSAHEQINAQRG